MSAHTPAADQVLPLVSKFRLYKIMTLMVASAILVSAAIIFYFDQHSDMEPTFTLNKVEVMTRALMPYMFSAAIAAMTAIAVLTILPNVRVCEPTQTLISRLRELREGDLASPVRIKSQNHLSYLAAELNDAVSTLGNQMAQMKVVNRQQWDYLELARNAALSNNTQEVLVQIEKMQANWTRIAEIEERLVTG